MVRSSLLVWLCLIPLALSAREYNIGDKYRDPLGSGGEGPDMVVIPGGSFVLGGGRPTEDGVGLIELPYRFAVSATEVTVDQYSAFLKAVGSPRERDYRDSRGELPIAEVSFDEAESYVAWLSRETGHYYRLPSASEWEYAARAGTSDLYSWGDEAGKGRANCLDCGTEYLGKTAPVGSFDPNAWGLYDMHGNVWEWTKDCVDLNTAPPANGMPKLFGDCGLRELRGGSAQSDSWSIRASARASTPRDTRIEDVGFRIVMEVPVAVE